MRIEAQGKYLQKIIEEQQKLGNTLRASETQPSSKDEQDHVQSEPSGDDVSAETQSPLKKQRVDDGSKNGITTLPTTNKDCTED